MIGSAIERVGSDPIVILRKSYLEICGDKDAAKLLSYFEYWHNVKVSQSVKNAHLNSIAEMHGESPAHDTSDLQYHTTDEIYEECLGDISRSGIRKARKILRELGFITEHRNPDPRFVFDKTIFYRLEVDKINAALREYSQTRQSDKKPIKPNVSNRNDRMCQNDTFDGDETKRSTYQNETIDVSKQHDRRIKTTRSIQEINNTEINNTEITTQRKSENSGEFLIARRIAEYLLTRIRQWKPNFRTPTEAQFNRWVVDIDKAIRIDGRTERQLVECIDWIYSKDGEFWRPNILSGRKLREKFDTMEAQMMRMRRKRGDDVISMVVGLQEQGRSVLDAMEDAANGLFG